MSLLNGTCSVCLDWAIYWTHVDTGSVNEETGVSASVGVMYIVSISITEVTGDGLGDQGRSVRIFIKNGPDWPPEGNGSCFPCGEVALIRKSTAHLHIAHVICQAFRVREWYWTAVAYLPRPAFHLFGTDKYVVFVLVMHVLLCRRGYLALTIT